MRTLAALLLALAGTLSAAAQDGTLDPAFHGDGRWAAGTAGSWYVTALAVAPQDGRLVLAGYHRDDPDAVEEFYWRPLSASTAGASCYWQPAGALSLSVHAAGFTPGGKLVLVGTVDYGGDSVVAVARFDYPDCTLDDSFDGNGYATFSFSGDAKGFALAIDPDNGKLVLAGTVWNGAEHLSDVLVMRLLGNGARDNSFDGNGQLAVDWEGGTDEARDVAIDGEGRIVVAGYVSELGGSFANRDGVLLRFLDNGDLDNSFSGDGKLRVAFDVAPATQAGSADWFQALAVEPSGRILAGGFAGTSVGLNATVVAVLDNGALDPDFRSGGKVHFRFELQQTHQQTTGLALEPTGRILLSGTSGDMASGEVTRLAAVRLRPDGEPDTRWSGDGVALVPFVVGGEEEPFWTHRTLLHDFQMVVGGEFVSSGVLVPAAARLRTGILFAENFDRGDFSVWSDTTP